MPLNHYGMNFNEKQIRIIEIAERMFAEQGYVGTSIRDIAKKSGINIAMVSYYFGSKEKLMEAIFKYRTEQAWFSMQETFLNSDIAPDEKIFKLLDSFLERIGEKAFFHSIVIRQQLLGERSPVIHQLDEAKQYHHNLVKKVIAEGQEKGIFRKDVDIAMIMVTMVGISYQFLASSNFYCKVSGLGYDKDTPFNNNLKALLREHLHKIFKALLFNQ